MMLNEIEKAVHSIHIPREHQSAPKEHWADKEIAKAAEEISTGQFVPVPEEDDFLGIRLSRGAAVQNPSALTGAELLRGIQETADSAALAQHPRVQEALRRLQQEKNEARTSQELLEKTQMLHEMNARSAQSDMWDGQGRWLGKENEEMRIVNIMSPQQFHTRLSEVVGERVFLNRFAVLKRVALMVPNTDAHRTIIIPGAPQNTDKFLQVGTLQFPCGPEWMVMRFDEYGVPKSPKYLGWRTALLSMINLKVITQREAHKAFPLSNTPAGAWYREQLFEIRVREGALD